MVSAQCKIQFSGPLDHSIIAAFKNCELLDLKTKSGDVVGSGYVTDLDLQAYHPRLQAEVKQKRQSIKMKIQQIKLKDGYQNQLLSGNGQPILSSKFFSTRKGINKNLASIMKLLGITAAKAKKVVEDKTGSK